MSVLGLAPGLEADTADEQQASKERCKRCPARIRLGWNLLRVVMLAGAVRFPLYQVVSSLITDKAQMKACADHPCDYVRLFPGRDVPGTGAHVIRVQNGMERPLFLEPQEIQWLHHNLPAVATVAYSEEPKARKLPHVHSEQKNGTDFFNKYKTMAGYLKNASEEVPPGLTFWSDLSLEVCTIVRQVVSWPSWQAARVFDLLPFDVAFFLPDEPDVVKLRSAKYPLQMIPSAYSYNGTDTTAGPRFKEYCEQSTTKQQIQTYMDRGMSKRVFVLAVFGWFLFTVAHDWVLMIHHYYFDDDEAPRCSKCGEITVERTSNMPCSSDGCREDVKFVCAKDGCNHGVCLEHAKEPLDREKIEWHTLAIGGLAFVCHTAATGACFSWSSGALSIFVAPGPAEDSSSVCFYKLPPLGALLALGTPLALLYTLMNQSQLIARSLARGDFIYTDKYRLPFRFVADTAAWKEGAPLLDDVHSPSQKKVHKDERTLHSWRWRAWWVLVLDYWFLTVQVLAIAPAGMTITKSAIEYAVYELHKGNSEEQVQRWLIIVMCLVPSLVFIVLGILQCFELAHNCCLNRPTSKSPLSVADLLRPIIIVICWAAGFSMWPGYLIQRPPQHLDLFYAELWGNAGISLFLFGISALRTNLFSISEEMQLIDAKVFELSEKQVCCVHEELGDWAEEASVPKACCRFCVRITKEGESVNQGAWCVCRLFCRHGAIKWTPGWHHELVSLKAFMPDRLERDIKRLQELANQVAADAEERKNQLLDEADRLVADATERAKKLRKEAEQLVKEKLGSKERASIRTEEQHQEQQRLVQ